MKLERSQRAMTRSKTYQGLESYHCRGGEGLMRLRCLISCIKASVIRSSVILLFGRNETHPLLRLEITARNQNLSFDLFSTIIFI